jgi:hypothetical protein
LPFSSFARLSFWRANFLRQPACDGITAAKARRVQTIRVDQCRRSSADHALFLRMTLIDICCGPPGELGIR